MDHRIVQPPLLSLLVLTCRATRAASVKASLTPLFFIAEHSVKMLAADLTPMVGLGHTEVSQSLDLLCHSKTLFVVDARLLWLRALSVVVFTLPQIALQRDEDKLDVGAVLGDLSDPLGLYVLKGVWRIDREAEHNGVRVIVAERS